MTAHALLVACLLVGCGTEVPDVSGAGWPNATLSELRQTGPGVEVIAQPLTVGPGGAQVRVELIGQGVEPCAETVSISVDGTRWPAAGPEPADLTDDGCVWSFTKDGAAVGSIDVIVEHDQLPYPFRWALP